MVVTQDRSVGVVIQYFHLSTILVRGKRSIDKKSPFDDVLQLH